MKEQLQYHLYKRFEVLQKLGEGTYGLVYKVLDKRTNQVSALKKVFDAFQNKIDSQRTYRQVHYLSETNHPRIVKLLDVITAKNQKDLYILCEFVEYDLLKTLKICDFASIQRKFVIQQLLQALSYLHENQIAHRDIKPSNILIDRNCNVKLCDFGLARYVGTNCATAEQPLTSYIAARSYRPPQVILGQQSYGTQVDIWGVGCILGQLILKQPIFNADSSNEILDRIFELIEKPKKADIRQFFIEQAQQKLLSIKSYKRISFYQKFNNATDEQIQMLTTLLQVIPQKRITAKQALKHRYFKQLQSQKLGPFQIITTKKDENQQNFSYRSAVEQISQKYRISQKSTISISAPFTQKYKDNSLKDNLQYIFTEKPKIISKSKKLNKSRSTIIVGENNKSGISSKKSVSKERAKSRNKGELSTIQFGKIQKSTVRKSDKSKLKIKCIKKKSTTDVDKKMFYSQKVFKDSLMQFLRK